MGENQKNDSMLVVGYLEIQEKCVREDLVTLEDGQLGTKLTEIEIRNCPH